MSADNLDEYSVKARVFPAFLVLLPLGIFLGQFVSMRSAIVGACSGLGGSALLSFVLAQWSRDIGKRSEANLWRDWGGAPTTTYLRHATASDNPLLKEQRKNKLIALAPELILPAAREEAENPLEADWHYEAATKALISKTRDRTRFEILFQENIAYGFRRNLWAMKPIGVSFCSLGIIGTLLLTFVGYSLEYNLVAAALCTVSLFLWLLVVIQSWVRRAADTYSERLFASLDNLESLK